MGAKYSYRLLGLNPHHRGRLRMLAIAFSAYLAMKFNHVDSVNMIQESRDPSQVHTILLNYALSLARDII